MIDYAQARRQLNDLQRQLKLGRAAFERALTVGSQVDRELNRLEAKEAKFDAAIQEKREEVRALERQVEHLKAEYDERRRSLQAQHEEQRKQLERDTEEVKRRCELEQLKAERELSERRAQLASKGD